MGTCDSYQTLGNKILCNLKHYRLEKTHTFATSYISTLKEVGLPSDMDNSHMLSIIEHNRTERSGQEIWREKKEACYPAGVDQLDDRGDEVINALHGSDINHERVDGDNPPRHKCWMCKTSAHWPDQCPKFAALSIEDRIKCAKANQVCFSFL